jgi:hypothetical protein
VPLLERATAVYSATLWEISSYQRLRGRDGTLEREEFERILREVGLSQPQVHGSFERLIRNAESVT